MHLPFGDIDIFCRSLSSNLGVVSVSITSPSARTLMQYTVPHSLTQMIFGQPSHTAPVLLATVCIPNHVHYYKSLLSDLLKINLHILQQIQNYQYVAHIITKTDKYNHNTPVLKDLHWLPIQQIIDFTTSLLELQSNFLK